jgi:hypothetical protein
VSNEHDFVSHGEEECEEEGSYILPPTVATDIEVDLTEEFAAEKQHFFVIVDEADPNINEEMAARAECIGTTVNHHILDAPHCHYKNQCQETGHNS